VKHRKIKLTHKCAIQLTTQNNMHWLWISQQEQSGRW